MNAEEHYSAAEELLGMVDPKVYEEPDELILAEASVHAQLAIAAGLIDATRRLDALRRS